mgnify:CR=1 FL=1
MRRDDVCECVGQAGLDIPADRIPAIAQRLREMHELASVIDDIDVGLVPPSGVFDPAWSAEGRS